MRRRKAAAGVASWPIGAVVALFALAHAPGVTVAQNSTAIDSSSSPTSPTPSAGGFDGAQFILNGEVRVFGRGLADKGTEIATLVQKVGSPIFARLNLDLHNFNITSNATATSPALAAYDTVDVAFLFTVADLMADVSQLLSYSSGNLLLNVLQGQLQQAGLNCTLVLLWVDYTSTTGSFPPTGTPPNFEAIRTQLQVVGPGLLPFTTDKQTLVLSVLRDRYTAVNAPFVCLNITSFVPPPAPAGRRLLQLQDTLLVDFEFIITPPAADVPSVYWHRMLGAPFQNETKTDGLPLSATYQNSTIRLEGPVGQMLSLTCDPPSAQCSDDVAPTHSSGSHAALIGGVVGGVLGGLLLLLAALLAFLLVRRRRRIAGRASSDGSASAAKGAADHEAAAGQGALLDSAGDDRSKADAGIGSRRLLVGPLRTVFGGPSPVANGDDSKQITGAQRELERTELADSAREGRLGDSVREDSIGADTLGESRRRTIRASSRNPRDPAKIPAGEIRICRREDGSEWRLGEGAFGQVYKAQRNGVQEVAVKLLTRGGDDIVMRELRREIAILRAVSADANVVQFYGAVLPEDDNTGQAMLVMEYMAGGDLRHALAADEDGEFAWGSRGREVALDIVRGLHFLHSSGVTHRDIKSGNILLTAEGRAKIADVGLAKMMTADYFSSAGTAGTFVYAAPEMLLGHHCSEKVDIYSYGIVLWEILTGRTPVRGLLDDPSEDGRCPPEVAALFWRCIATDAAERPSAEEVFKALEALP